MACPLYAQTALLAPPFATYTYILPENCQTSLWKKGQRVAAPVGKNLRPGLIVEISAHVDLDPGIKCRSLCWPLEKDPLLTDDIVNLACDLGKRQGITEGFILGHTLPKGLRTTKINTIISGKIPKTVFTCQQIAALDAFQYLKLSEALLAGEASFATPGKSDAEAEICSLAIDPPWPLRPAAKKQIAILDFLYAHGRVSRKKLTTSLGADAAAPLRKLAEKNYVHIELDEPEYQEGPELAPPLEPVFELNADQKAAIADMLLALKGPTAQTRLLYGVTGSGKTAVYMAIARKCLALGKSILLLAPEVALAHKLFMDVQHNLPDLPHFLYHGYQTQSRREQMFLRLSHTRTPVVLVGTRSALFLPIYNPGCIILDEEHDGSYKQDDVFSYHARELAWFRMQAAKGLLVLGSATPDIRTFYAAQKGLLTVLRLPKRASGRELPPVELVRLGERTGFGSTADNTGLLAPECEAALMQTLAKGEQAVILLNRRGYAPLIYCQSCEQTIQCPDCKIGMTFHKGIGRLVCHYCGFNIPWPGSCPRCGGSNFLAMGEGTERIAERLETLAGQPILRLDRDSARRNGKIEEILTDFANGLSPYLVGTQMLSKGHHFPNVTLVVVADGDIGLNLPDYRASEKTFQLLAQAAGRAGRGEKPGRALIQTRNPQHYCWEHIVNYNYEGFYEAELALRKKYRYPPFVKLGLLRFSFPMNNDNALEHTRALGTVLRKEAKNMNAQLLGPTPAPLPILKGKKRMQCLIKTNEWKPMRELWFFAQKNMPDKNVRITLDIDPVNML